MTLLSCLLGGTEEQVYFEGKLSRSPVAYAKHIVLRHSPQTCHRAKAPCIPHQAPRQIGQVGKGFSLLYFDWMLLQSYPPLGQRQSYGIA